MGCDWDGIACHSHTPLSLSPPHVLGVTGDCPLFFIRFIGAFHMHPIWLLHTLSLQVSQKVPLVIVQGHLVSEGILLFGQQHFYICENFTLSPTGDVYCIRHCLSKWVFHFPQQLSPRPASFQFLLFPFQLFTEGLEPTAMAPQGQLLDWVTCCMAVSVSPLPGNVS